MHEMKYQYERTTPRTPREVMHIWMPRNLHPPFMFQKKNMTAVTVPMAYFRWYAFLQSASSCPEQRRWLSSVSELVKFKQPVPRFRDRVAIVQARARCRGPPQAGRATVSNIQRYNR
jgi:hypothetical protein